MLNARKLRRCQDQPDLILLVIQDVTVLHDREVELQKLARQREILVQEVHHRVKNNLQTIASLLSLHSGYAEDPRVIDALGEAQGRVQAIARLHEKFYATLADVNVGEYLRNLTDTLQSLHGRPDITVKVEAVDLILDMEHATPLALIANELILNCFKHAFPVGVGGHVAVSLTHVSDSSQADRRHFFLEIKDNGSGLPPGINFAQSHSMGLELVRLLCQQLGAVNECFNDNGLTWRIRFPLPPASME